MEGVAASRWTMKVDTTNTRVEIATTSYGRGGNAIANVGLFTTSNVVVGAGNAVVLWATGSATLGGQQVATGTIVSVPNLLPSTNSWTGGNTFAGVVTITTAPVIYLSTQTILTGGVQTYTAATNTLVPGSQIAFTTSFTSRFRVSFNCVVNATVNNYILYVGVLKDGGFFDGQSDTVGLQSTGVIASAQEWPLSFSYVTQNAYTPAPSHWAVWVAVSGGGYQLQIPQALCQFRVEQVP